MKLLAANAIENHTSKKDASLVASSKEKLKMDIPTYYIIKTYDVRGRIEKHYVVEDVLEEAQDKFEEEVEGLQMNNEVECKVELWTGKPCRDYQDMPGDQPPQQITRIDEDELLETKHI